MKISKAFKLPSGTIVPAGTELHFSNEGQGYFEGEEVQMAKIPSEAVQAAQSDIEAAQDAKYEGYVSSIGDPETLVESAPFSETDMVITNEELMSLLTAKGYEGGDGEQYFDAVKTALIEKGRSID